VLRDDSIRVLHPLFQEGGGGSIPTSSLQLHVGQISVDLAIDLVALWHSRLPIVNKSNIQRTKHLWCVGAEYSGKWYACAIWTNPISPTYADAPYLELRRFAIASDAPKNTASRLIGVMTRQIKKKFPSIERLISYQDTDVHMGTIYAASGWVASGHRKGGDNIWTTSNRKRNIQQATGDKIRWEYPLTPLPICNKRGD
jgi:hypothetical protein